MSYMREITRQDWPSYARRASLEETYRDISDMVHAGGAQCHTTPNLKYAFASAILSANNRIDRNGWQVNAIRQYDTRFGHWPTSVQEYQRITEDAGFMCGSNHADYLLRLNSAWHSGALYEVCHMPTDAASWLLWRHSAVNLIKGLGNKTASFAALLAWPYHSPLVPCDRHVIARLAFAGAFETWNLTPDAIYKKMNVNSAPGYRMYRSVERLVGNEKLRLGLEMPTGIWHWHMWRAWLMFIRTEENDASHELLSPYWYPEETGA